MSEVMTRPKWTWEEVHQVRHWGTCPEPAMARFVRRRLKPGDWVLDVGCGVGAQTFWLNDNGFNVNAIDVSPTAIRRMMERPAPNHEAVGRRVMVVADVTRGLVDMPSNSHDAAIDVCCLQHIVNPAELSRAMSGIRSALKPGGWLFSVLATDRHAQIAFGGMEAHGYRASEAVALFKHAGFNVVTIHTKEHTDDFKLSDNVVQTGTVAHWLIEAVKKDA